MQEKERKNEEEAHKKVRALITSVPNLFNRFSCRFLGKILKQ